ncbi:hypothetical protein A2757_02855 [Candidatus Giovannonibacteria bacterium RIFCSPHIGHO2_01_FULL_48_47]|nr:MAG: hypothetical protein A2757_02855 [Candidatus Giovannonibacteria bacterium RIFCSPHIGHO2_01_FULL_48_47]OGF68473.1 MAG: hypothetical protein A3D61_00295 [Candidatus Giovannonibacteria bacterium RIFCSPHIGHO2_02_FULL_48_15]OGF88675.1 MAG: hypothetical protein A3B26_03480 [Candidatus Giovannonibacteria bacterium RIFCSPLOWO2_01_FULL_48_47]OGF94595.1 MAG: hypothetical protein A2433_03245 [Candidatus Giovannonibacteria bacterium RIFOXYC1_FULL_48_8]OGF95928.1 MAG: hypothetical protein A2613_03895
MAHRNLATIDKKIEKTRFRGEPVVVIPLEDWRKLEDLMEDTEMRNSNILPKEIIKARKEKKLYSAAEVKRLLRL